MVKSRSCFGGLVKWVAYHPRSHRVVIRRGIHDEQGVIARCDLVAGDFFDRVPGDAYILK